MITLHEAIEKNQHFFYHFWFTNFILVKCKINIMLPIIKTNKKQDTYLQVISGVNRIFKNIGGGGVDLLSDKNLPLPPLKFSAPRASQTRSGAENLILKHTLFLASAPLLCPRPPLSTFFIWYFFAIGINNRIILFLISLGHRKIKGGI